MRRSFHLYLPLLAIATSAGCSTPPAATEIATGATGTSASALALSQGLYPYPVAMLAGGTAPQKDANGKVIVSWTGSLADLMAADAYADCAQQWDGLNEIALDESASDTYIQYLESKMTANESCAAACAGGNGGCSWKFWYSQRTVAACNYNTSNQTPQALSWDTRDVSAYQAIGIPQGPAAIQSGPGRAGLAAATQLGIAEENLCMAQKLREEMVTAPGLLLQEADERELLEVIRERAQIALLQYSILGVVFTSPDTRTWSTYDYHQILPILRAFGNNSSYASYLTQIGRDFAAAVELHAQTTQELATDLARNASARVPWPTAPLDQPGLDWSTGSWRERVLRLMYGGDPLAATDTGTVYTPQSDSLWQVYSGSWSPGIPTSYITEDARNPYVDELMTLARNADALYFLASDVSSATYATTAAQLYRTVEASLENPGCMTPASADLSCAADAYVGIPDPTTSAITTSKLYQLGITLDDAVALVTRIGQAMPSVNVREFCFGRTCSTLYGDQEGTVHFTGPQDYIASPEDVLPGAATGAWYHLAPNTVAIPQSITERASGYMGSFYLPMAVDILNVAPTQGFVANVNGTIDGETLNGSTTMRTLGAVSALGVARDALFTAQLAVSGTTGTATSRAFVSAASVALPLIASSIGTQTAAVRPELISESVSGDPCTEWGDTTPSACAVIAQAETNADSTMGAQPLWQVTVETNVADAFTQLAVFTGESMAATAALDPNFVSYEGTTMASLVSDSDAQVLAPTSTQATPDGTIRRIYTVYVDNTKWFFLVQPAAAGGTPAYKLLFGPQALTSSYVSDTGGIVAKSIDGRWLGSGGSLNTFAARLWATQPQNWSQPEYDAFGLPLNWFPPSSPELFGGQPGESALTFYEAQAQASASSAQNAIASAVGALLAQEGDQATLTAAQQKAGTLSLLAEQGLCGNSTTCAADIAPISFSLFSDPSNGSSAFVQPLACANVGLPASACQNNDVVVAYNTALNQIVPSAVELPSIVWNSRWSSAQPAFSSYAGGQLQTDFVADWGALNALTHASASSNSAIAAKIQAANTAEATLTAANSVATYQCSTASMTNAMYAGITTSTQGGVSVKPGGGTGAMGNSNATSVFTMNPGKGGYTASVSVGPLWSQIQACQSATAGLPVSQAQAASAIADAWSSVGEQLQSIGAVVNTLFLATAKVGTDATAASTAVAQAQLDSTLTAAGLQTRFGTYRRFYSYDMANAVQALQTARINAVEARRAIESRYVVDMSTMLTAEPSVAAPSTWADQIYGSDLAPLGSVGLTVSGVQGGQAPANTDFLTQYVSNLGQFASGYFAASRKAAVQPSTGNAIMLPVPDGRIIDANGNQVLDPASLVWTFQCAGQTTWFTNPAAGMVPAPSPSPLLNACAGNTSPSDARLTFSFDGWGRLNSTEGYQPAMQHDFNVRWNSLALNLVGGGVTSSLSQAYVPYNMTAVGPSWVTDYDESWHALDTPIGYIENGQAVATDNLWNQPPSAQSQSEIGSVSEDLFVLRPVAGTYQLDLLVTSGVNLSNIQYVQIYTNVETWVIQ